MCLSGTEMHRGLSCACCARKHWLADSKWSCDTFCALCSVAAQALRHSAGLPGHACSPRTLEARLAPQAVVERLWLAQPRLPSPAPSVASGVRLGARAPSAPLPALVDNSKPPALVLGGGTAQACTLTLLVKLWFQGFRVSGLPALAGHCQ